VSSLADAYPREQERVRAVRAHYAALDGMPQVNVKPALLMIDDLLRRADAAAMAGDVLTMLRIYEEMRETQ
jgi:hypothetical protein